MKDYHFSQLAYIPTDFEAVAAKLRQYAAAAAAARTPEELIAADRACDELCDEVGFAGALAYIRSSLDCTDEFYAEAAQKEAMGAARMDTAGYIRALLASPLLPALEERFGPEYRPRLEREVRLKTAGQELMAQEQALISQYQQKKAQTRVPFRGKERSEAEMYALFDSPDRATRFEARRATCEAFLAQKDLLAPMLRQLVRLRCEIAKANGFASYLDYANTSFFRRGYGEAELTAFCGQVKAHLVPLLQTLRGQQRAALGLEKLMSWDLSVQFAGGNAVPAGDAAALTRASQAMYNALSPEFGRFFRAMTASGSLDVTASPNKVAGMGFCAPLAPGYLPYVFGNCNGTDYDVTVFTHEIGHAWQMHRTTQALEGQGMPANLREMALDAVEIPSKTMELFAYPYAEGFFGADAEKFRQGHFRKALFEVAAYCQIHEWNTWLYTHPDASFEEMAAAGLAVGEEYEPGIDHGPLRPLLEQGAALLRNLAVYSFPRYVISYSLSEMCAIELFARMQTDPAGAWQAYNALCAMGGSRSYPETLRAAGLSPAYAPGSVQRAAQFARGYLGL